MKKGQQNKKDDSSLETDPYQPESVPLFEAIYGKNLISLGGLAAVDNMFRGVNIKGLKALDLGFGLGGVAFYLAEKYQMNIAGIEIPLWMVQYAQDHTPKHLSHLLEFNTYNSTGEIPYKPETFDLVYSKGVLNHVSDKSSLFRQIHTALKPDGLFVIADWIFPCAPLESTAPLICETEASYTLALTNAGFDEIDFRDDSQLFLSYAEQLLINLTSNRKFIEQKYEPDLFSIIWKQHEDLIEKINLNEKFAVRITARKGSS